ncbi:MAG: hypothetical protein QOI78_7935, partial [Actinomycetota bacterium]|nr:hypothetical protein [Actinomycetota bacterium]
MSNHEWPPAGHLPGEPQPGTEPAGSAATFEEGPDELHRARAYL